jgi:carbamate kinase
MPGLSMMPSRIDGLDASQIGGTMLASSARNPRRMYAITASRDDLVYRALESRDGGFHWETRLTRLFKLDGDSMLRVVPSPAPRRILEQQPIRWMLEHGCVVICAGGGGIPTAYRSGRLVGVEAVIDKDHASALLANNLEADMLIMATDAPAAYVDFGTPDQRVIVQAGPDTLLSEHAAEFAAGSMLPKVTAACNFAGATNKVAVIGALADIEGMLAGTAGTRISTDVSGVVLAPSNS